MDVRAEDNVAYSKVIVFHLFVMYCKNMLVSTSDAMYQMNDMFNTVILVLIVIIYGKLIIKNHLLNTLIRGKVFFILVFLACFFMISCLIDPQLFRSNKGYYYYVNYDLRLFIAYCLPLFILSVSLVDLKEFLERIYRNTWVLFGAATISFVLFLTAPKTLTDYSMSYGYAVMPFAIFQLFKYKELKKKRYLIEVIVTIGYILIAGSRGPIVCIMAAFFAVFFIKERKVSKKIVLVLFVGVLLFTFLVVAKPLLTRIVLFFSQRNIVPRSLYLMLIGRGTYDSGRTVIFEQLITAINNHPILGLGAFGGEVEVALAHSLYLDIFANFGYVFGSFFLLGIFAGIYNGLLRNKRSSSYDVLLILCVMCFPKGFYSGGLWTEKELWMIIGLLISGVFKNKQEEIHIILDFDYKKDRSV